MPNARKPASSKADATNPYAIAFGRRLTNLREAKGITQEELADRAALHRTAISLLERGLREPRLAQIVKLAGSLEVDVAALTDGHDLKPKGKQ